MQPVAVLEAGVAILDPILRPAGFAFGAMESGRGSGGDYASGEYSRGGRRLELHFRHSLGLVTYHVGDHMLSHEAYMRALGVGLSEAQYPGYSNNPMDGFRHLAADLTRFGTEFLTGDAAVLLKCAPLAAQERATARSKEQARYEGDDSRRDEAMRLLHAGEYVRALASFNSVHYPGLLSDAERRGWELARSRAQHPGIAR